MRAGALTALEAVGLVITALTAQAVIRGLLDPESELLWGAFEQVPGGRGGHLVLLGSIALVATLSVGWAHTRDDRTPADPTWGTAGRR